MKSIKKLTVNFASNYIHYHYGYLKHDIKKLVKASRDDCKTIQLQPLRYILFYDRETTKRNLYTFLRLSTLQEEEK